MRKEVSVGKSSPSSLEEDFKLEAPDYGGRGEARARKSTAKKGVVTENKKITIPAMKTGKILVTIKGISPLITHAWAEKSLRQMRDKQEQKARQKKAAKDPVADFEAAKYLLKGKDVFPAQALKNAIVSACRFTSDAKMTVIRGALFVKGEQVDDWVHLKYDECRMREDVVRIGGFNKVADLRHRPEYLGWSAKFYVEYSMDVLSADQVYHLISRAGFSIGLHEWRPERGGQYGRFEVLT